MRLIAMIAALGLGLVATPAAATGDGQASMPTSDCSTNTARIDKDFPTGAFASCETTGDRRFKLTIAPEDEGDINCSAWYAFRVTPQQRTRITIDLDYETCGHPL